MKFVEVAWYGLIPGPSGNTNVNSKLVTFSRFNGYVNQAFPRIPRLLIQLDPVVGCFNRGFAADKKVHIYIIVLMCIGITRHRGNEPGDIGGTARTVKPRASCMLTGGFERIRIEEEVAFHRYSPPLR